MSVGNLTPGILKGCRTLHSHPSSSGIPSANKYSSDKLLSAEPVPSQEGSFICPSKTHCTHICGLQVAVTVGLEGDPLGRKVIGLLVSVSVTVGVAEVTGILIFIVFPSEVTANVSTISSDVVTQFCSLTEAKNCLVEAIASSLSACLVLLIFLEGST